MRPLDPREERLLRQLEEQILEEDPQLAERLRTLRPPFLVRFAPTRWHPGVYLAIAAVLLPTGLVLDDRSSFVGGLLSAGLAWLRHRDLPG